MPFVPFTKKSAGKDDASVASAAPAAPAFSKKSARRKRKSGTAAPMQKSLMSSGRTFGGGGR